MSQLSQLRQIAHRMVSGARGILAADESIGTMSKRLKNVGIEPTEENRRAYREMLVTTPDLSAGISGVIFNEETLRQRLTSGDRFNDAATALGILPGVKVDTGTVSLAGASSETVTEGLDGLRPRLSEFAQNGIQFAKWRAVIRIASDRPSGWAIRANAHALACYAKLCQEEGLVPVVEPEVLMEGDHTMSACAKVTHRVLSEVFDILGRARVDPAGTVLKPNMVIAGIECPEQVSPHQVAAATLDVLRDTVPRELAGVAFLSGGQGPVQATENLAAMQVLDAPWPLTFSFGRALLDPPLQSWHAEPGRTETAQQALSFRVACNTAALEGTYTVAMEKQTADA